MPLDESAEDEIRRFEEQFRRQPESLVFARLADAYRKAGDPHRALAVLEEGIRRHMDYLSAHIVRARTYRDLGRFEDARSAFGRVIEIDAENLVAIQGLAEVAREADDTAAEIAWLERLALADPQNPEPGARLEQLRRLAGQDTSAEQGPDLAEAGESPAKEETWWSEKAAVEADSQATGALTSESDLASELWSGPLIIPDHESEEGPESAREDEVESVEASAAGPPEEWEDTAGALTDPFIDPDIGSFEDPDMDPFEDMGLDIDVSGGSPAAERAAKGAWWFEPPAKQDPTEPAGATSDDADSADDADLLTRTMAELYARQGLIDEAEAIYRELMRDRPDDETLRDGLDAVLGMRAARGAARAPDIPAEAVEVEVSESAASPDAPESVPAADDLTALLRAGEALVHRLPEPPSSPLEESESEAESAGMTSAESEPSEEQPAVRPVLEEWLRGLRS